MGCATSKLDDLPAVALCKERCGFLDEAIRYRFQFAHSHLAYINTLKGIGVSLHDFIQQDYYGDGSIGPGVSPPQQKQKAAVQAKAESSHIEFNSDSDEDGDDLSETFSHHHLHGSDDHSHHSSPLHSEGQIGYFPNAEFDQQDSFFGGNGFVRMNYMKKQTTPSVVYQQRPVNSETVYFGDNYYPQNDWSPNYGYNNNNPNYGYFQAPFPGGGGDDSRQRVEGGRASTSKAPPPPPSPPRESAWEFLNPFENYDKFYSQFTPSRDSKELREEEGIPDLEDEDEVVKEVDGDEKFVGTAKSVVVEEEGGGEEENVRGSAAVENERMEFDVHVVDKKVVDSDRDEGRSSRPGDRSQVAVEIKIQFERASECGNEIAELLEVGTLPYHKKYASKLLQGVPASLSVISSQPSTSGSSGEAASSSVDKYAELDEDLARRSKNLSSTLHKLHLWEKKLYNEVKIEEKMRVAHDRKVRKLKRLDERGAEVQKVHATQTVIRSLSTKIKMAIQVVDKISITINKIRDEELWPQLNLLVEGLNRMWKNMLECHHIQCQAVREARNLGPLGSGKKRSDSDLEATLQLERELLAWTSSFSSWISAQKGYVRALNNWLVKCLLYEPEETADGIVPFSPGRLGAPPVFVICNQWAQAMDRISEREVIQAMRVFAMSVLQLWEQDKAEMQQRMMANKDLERKVRNLDREDQKIQKEIQALDKKIVVVAGDDNNLPLSGNVLYQSDIKNLSLQGCLQRIFEAMERFVAESMKAYEELLQRAEEEKLSREHDRVS